jgi:fibronectin-binding autotransporter adhesin
LLFREYGHSFIQENSRKAEAETPTPKMKTLNTQMRGRGGVALFSFKRASRVGVSFLLAIMISLFVNGLALAQTTNYWKTSGGGTWSTTGNWTAGSAPTLTSLVVFNTNTLNGAETITLSGTANALGMVFSNTGTTTIRSANGTTRTLNLSSRGISVASGAGAVTIGNTSSNIAIALSAAQGWTNSSGNTLNIVSTISGNFALTLAGTGNTTLSGIRSGSTSAKLVMNGTGTATLTAANTFAGGTTLNAGTLAISNNAAFGTGTVSFASNATVAALANLTVTNNYTIASGKTATFDDNGFTLTNSGVISGAGALTKIDTGTLTLTGTNTYTGTTTVSNGVLSLGATGKLTASTNIVVNGGGTLLLGSTNQVTTSSALTLGGGTLSLGGGATRAGSNSFSTLTLTADSVIDFSALSGDSILSFTDILGLDTFKLTILDWNGTTEWGTVVGGGTTTKLLDAGSLSQSQLSNISFYRNGDTNSEFLGTGVFAGSQVIPVPEPAVVLAGGLLLGWLALSNSPLLRRKIDLAIEGRDQRFFCEKSNISFLLICFSS